MADDQNANVTQETPVEGTPPVETASDEQAVVTETPEANATDSTTTQAEPAGEKTAEQLKADVAYHQTEAQTAKFDAKQAQAELANLGTQDLLGTTTPQTAQSDAPAVNQTEVNRIEQMSDDDFNQFTQDNPALVYQAMQTNIRRELDQRDQRTEARQAQMVEKDQANQTLNRWKTENDVTMEELTAAKEQLTAFGIKAPPAGVASMLINQVNNNLSEPDFIACQGCRNFRAYCIRNVHVF